MNDTNKPPAPEAEHPFQATLNKLRTKAIELDRELGPLTKDAPVPGAPQKVARRLQKGLGLVVELCDSLEAHVLPRIGKK